MLIDGNSLAYRAFFALPTDLATASGQITNAVFGFTSMIINLWRDHQPDNTVVAFDRPGPTFRHEMVSTYKGTRESAPDILRQQMGLVREVLETLAVPTVETDGYEADDIVATLAAQAKERGDDVIIVTGDRDAYQLVEDPHVKVLYNMRGVSDYALYDEAGIRERTGVAPTDYVAYAALRGDSSDNLPGVRGVGDKTAAKLVNEHRDLDGIFSSLATLTPRLRENLAAAEAQVRSNAQVMLLVRDVPLGVGLSDLRMGEIDGQAVRKLFDFLEFRSLHPRLAEVFGDVVSNGSDDAREVLQPAVTVCASAAEATEMLTSLANGTVANGTVANGRAATCTTPLVIATPQAGLQDGLALALQPGTSDVGFVPAELLQDPVVLAALRLLLKRPGDVSLTSPASQAGETSNTGEGLDAQLRPLALHDAKTTMRALLDMGVEMRDPLIDTMLAAYLLDPADGRYHLAAVTQRYTDLEIPTSAPDEGRLDFDGAGSSADTDTDADTGSNGESVEKAAWSVLAVDHLVAPLQEALAAQGLDHLHDEVEVPLVRVLARMEHIGIGVDRPVLQRISDELSEEAEVLKQAVLADAGRPINVNSPKQLGQVLFDDLGLTPTKRTKTGYSTDAQSLEKLRGEHPIVEHLLAYREVEKLRSTYGSGLLSEVAPDGRIHATFNQTVARTGRLSSDAPNLHNIPVRSERGRVFRTAFTAREGCRLLVADYNQIELRCIAHLAHDPGLISAFEAGDDIHTATAARVFGIAPSEVGVEERATAKMVSYGLAYGMEAYGLGQRLNISTSEAAVILDAYFMAFPEVRRYMNETVEEARRKGYTETLFKRRRQIPELASSNTRMRQAGERQAMNAGIQGLAADIFKVALVRLDRALEAAGLVSRIVLQVHDEIIVESPEDEIIATSDLINSVMRGAFELVVPLEVDLKVARRWSDAKG